MAVNHKKSKMEGGHKKILLQGYKNHLKTLGYSESTVYSFPLQLGEYLEFLETKKALINEKTALEFMAYFKERKHKRRDGGLSTAHINKQTDVLNTFFRYLQKTGKTKSIIKLKRIKNKELRKIIILDKKEIKQLYEIAENNILGMRDKAMLSIYYGCGLRKKEGLELFVEDILFDRRLLYVRPSKNGKDRYVPINENSLKILEEYIFNARPYLVNQKEKSTYLLLSIKGNQLSGSSAVYRFKRLLKRSGIGKEIGLHGLRHSIATHLLESDLSLKNISRFLGHSSIGSTQIYTHLKSK